MTFIEVTEVVILHTDADFKTYYSWHLPAMIHMFVNSSEFADVSRTIIHDFLAGRVTAGPC